MPDTSFGNLLGFDAVSIIATIKIADAIVDAHHTDLAQKMTAFDRFVFELHDAYPLIGRTLEPFTT